MLEGTLKLESGIKVNPKHCATAMAHLALDMSFTVNAMLTAEVVIDKPFARGIEMCCMHRHKRYGWEGLGKAGVISVGSSLAGVLNAAEFSSSPACCSTDSCCCWC
jgi:hypothetical protein